MYLFIQDTHLYGSERIYKSIFINSVPDFTFKDSRTLIEYFIRITYYTYTGNYRNLLRLISFYLVILDVNPYCSKDNLELWR